MKSKHIITAILFLVIIFLSGCVARERYVDLLDEAKTYQKNLNRERSRNTELSKKISDLEKTVATLTEESRSLQADLEKAKVESTKTSELTERAGQLESSIKEERAQFEAREKERLAEIVRLKGEIERVKGDADKAGQLNKKLTDLNQEMDNLKVSFQGREAILKEEIERLQIQIASLKDEAVRKEKEAVAIKERYEDMIVGLVKKMTKGE